MFGDNGFPVYAPPHVADLKTASTCSGDKCAGLSILSRALVLLIGGVIKTRNLIISEPNPFTNSYLSDLSPGLLKHPCLGLLCTPDRSARLSVFSGFFSRSTIAIEVRFPDPALAYLVLCLCLMADVMVSEQIHQAGMDKQRDCRGRSEIPCRLLVLWKKLVGVRIRELY